MILFLKIFRKLASSLLLSGIGAGLTFAAPLLSTAALNEIEPSATEAVKSTITDLMQVLDDDTLKQSEQAEERRHEIEEIIKHRVDYAK